MAVYVDNSRVQWQGKEWCHMVADTLTELHQFAESIGMRPEWFQASASYPHYDVTVARRQLALSQGAVVGERRQIIRCAKKLKAEQTLILGAEYRQLGLLL
ncbi:DUF4031 domain-containing protein [Marinobacter alexandrii]|uniref:DUF4031 domain-containing protein n=1 Tax=Marinobacter alexandrii TaxID=2570351 RepID=UPI001109E96C|nr:DUF4031 domain-containing protein [Marinobacter alexandrii]